MRQHALTYNPGDLGYDPAKESPENQSDKLVVAAAAEGLIEFKIGEGMFHNRVWVPHPTSKGLPYSTGPKPSGKLIMAIPVPTEITSVGEPSQMAGKTISIVNFKITYNLTPFGTIFERITGKRNEYSGWDSATAAFALYDDGWHLEQWNRN